MVQNAVFTLLSLTIFLSPILALTRTVGPPTDIGFQSAARACNVTYPSSFGSAKCPYMINCVLGQLDNTITAGMQAGGNIAALIPTALTLIGAPPLDLVQLATCSPHRALATCLFSIGLPVGLFRQLKPMLPYLADRRPDQPRVRVWRRPVPRTNNAQLVTARLVADVVIFGLAAVMLWRNWYIGTFVTITWRCEYSWLLICWPMANVLWLVIAVIILMLFSSSIIFTYSEDDAGVTRGFLSAIMLTYRAPKPRSTSSDSTIVQHRDPKRETPATKASTWSPDSPTLRHRPRQPSPIPNRSPSLSSDPMDYYDGPTLTVKITMRSAHGLRSWRVFEALIETLALGIYLYATFVLTSTLFLSGQEAIIYACIMILSLSVVRVVGIVL